MIVAGAGKGLLSSVRLDADARALFARMSTQPSGSRKRLISDTIKSLKTAGLWPILSYVYFLAAHDIQAGRLNWKNTTGNLQADSGHVFTADQGFTVGTSAGPELSTAVAVAKPPQDNATVAVQSMSPADTNSPAYFGQFLLLYPRDIGAIRAGVNSQDIMDTPLSGTARFGVASRTDGSTARLLANDGAVQSFSHTSRSSNSSEIIRIGGGSPGATVYRFVAFGAGLTAGQMTALRTITKSYFTKLGISV